MYLKRPGGQAQFSDALKLQTRDEAFDHLHGWMASRLAQDLSVESLAEFPLARFARSDLPDTHVRLYGYFQRT